MSYGALLKWRKDSFDYATPNEFIPVTEAETASARREYGVEFPPEMVEFWQQVGQGFLRENARGDASVSEGNYILGPIDVAQYMSGRHPSQEYGASDLEDGDIPVMDMSDGALIVIRGDGLYWSWDGSRTTRLADSVPQFIERLLEDPGFTRDYDDTGRLNRFR